EIAVGEQERLTVRDEQLRERQRAVRACAPHHRREREGNRWIAPGDGAEPGIAHGPPRSSGSSWTPSTLPATSTRSTASPPPGCITMVMASPRTYAIEGRAPGPLGSSRWYDRASCRAEIRVSDDAGLSTPAAAKSAVTVSPEIQSRSPETESVSPASQAVPKARTWRSTLPGRSKATESPFTAWRPDFASGRELSPQASSCTT